MRKKLCKLISIIILLCSSSQTFAVCEQERRERDQFKESYDNAARTAAAACAAGSIFTIITFGTSLIPCAAAGLTADNQKRILDEKEMNLRRCEDESMRVQREAAERAIRREEQIRAIQAECDTRRAQIIRDFEVRSQQIPNEYVAQGFDVTHPDIQAEILAEQATLQAELNQILKSLEEQRQREMEGIER